MKAKKIIVLLTIVCMLCGLVACGKDEVSKTGNDSQDIVSEDNQTMENTNDKNNDVETEYDVIGYKYYDYPATHWIKTEGYFHFVMLDEQIMIATYEDLDGEVNESLEAIIDYVNEDRFTISASCAGEGGPTFGLGEDVKVTSSEKVTIAGMDCMKFEGTTLNKGEDDITWDAYVYGYTFLVDEISYAVIGIVTPEEQEQSMIDEMKQQVDDIMASMRDER